MINKGKVMLICGKLCCGKSTYSAGLRRQNRAVILSVDDITLALLGEYAGDRLFEMTDKVKAYLLAQAVEISNTGIPVILDWGFWSKKERADISAYLKVRGIPIEWHYLDVPDEVWRQRIEKRNRAIMENKTAAYPVDDNLLKLLIEKFQPPEREEIDVWHISSHN